MGLNFGLKSSLLMSKLLEKGRSEGPGGHRGGIGEDEGLEIES